MTLIGVAGSNALRRQGPEERRFRRIETAADRGTGHVEIASDRGTPLCLAAA
jgi:hypothetical protein